MLNEQQIIELLAKAGNKGMTCKKLAKHIFNANNSLFEEVSFDDIYRDLQAYLNKRALCRHPYIEKTDEWGYYRLNKQKLREKLEWIFEDENHDNEEDIKKEPIDSPSLFDGFY